MAETKSNTLRTSEQAQHDSSPESPPAHVPIDTVVKSIDQVSTIPHAALRVMEAANDPTAGVAEMKQAIEGDPSLCVRVMRCVNSSAYALRSEVTNLERAISYLGFHQVRNLALTASVSNVFKKDQPIGSYCRKNLWKHLVSVGICARMIAMRRRLPNFEDAFLAGLLHDIGIILEDEHVHEHFCAVIQSLNDDSTLTETENAILGFDHTALGTRMAEEWKFPTVVQAAIRFHHASESYEGDDIEIVQCIEIANLVCTLKGISSVGLKLTRLPRAGLAGLSLDKEDIKALATDLDHEFSRHEVLFQI